MYTDWKVFFTQFIPNEDYIPDNIGSKNINVFLFFLFLGFIAALGLTAKVSYHEVKSIDAITSKQDRVKAQIKTFEENNANIESELFILNHSITKTLATRQNSQLSKLSKLVGFHKETGRGVILQLNDNERPLSLEENPGSGIIHNTDLVRIVNELWAAKAAAVAINNKRVTVQSQISCIGPTILINKERVAPPFVIKAIGDPKKLFSKLNKGYVQILGSNGIKYIIEKYNSIEIPADGNIILAGEN